MTGQNILTATHVQEAIRIMYPFNPNSKEINAKEVLKQVGVFDYRKVDALVATGSEEDLYRLIDESAKAVISFYDSLEEDKKFRIKWGENVKKMVEKVRLLFTDWFEKAGEMVHQITLKEQFEDKIKSGVDRVKRFVSALIDTEEKAQSTKAEIDELFAKIKEEIEASDLNQSAKEDLIVAMEAKTIKDCYDFVDVKLVEKPVYVLYYRTGNRVSVKANLNKNGYTYTQGRGKEVRYNKGKDREQFPLIVSVHYIEDFLYKNKVRDEDILVDTNSVDHYYSFEGFVSFNLTPSFVETWYNHDLPELYRHTPNKHRHVTMLGMPICHFSNKLVETSWSADYIDESISEEEVQALSKEHEQSGVVREMRNVLKARKMKEEGKKEELESYINSFDQRIQTIIDDNASTILERVAQMFPQRASIATGTDGQSILSINDNFGFDCGFLNIYPIHAEYTEKRSILRNIDHSVAPWMNLQIPYGTQSTTVQTAQFEIIKGIVLKETGIELIGRTVLD
jgi:hypothetical protein